MFKLTLHNIHKLKCLPFGKKKEVFICRRVTIELFYINGNIFATT